MPIVDIELRRLSVFIGTLLPIENLHKIGTLYAGTGLAIAVPDDSTRLAITFTSVLCPHTCDLASMPVVWQVPLAQTMAGRGAGLQLPHNTDQVFMDMAGLIKTYAACGEFVTRAFRTLSTCLDDVNNPVEFNGRLFVAVQDVLFGAAGLPDHVYKTDVQRSITWFLAAVKSPIFKLIEGNLFTARQSNFIHAVLKSHASDDEILMNIFMVYTCYQLEIRETFLKSRLYQLLHSAIKIRINENPDSADLGQSVAVFHSRPTRSCDYCGLGGRRRH